MKTRLLHIIIIAAAALFMALPLSAQRRITPVGVPSTGTSYREKTDSVRPAGVVEQLDAKGNTILVDTITGREYVDSAAIRPSTKMVYPTINGLQVGLNLWDAALRIFGQHYGLGSAWATLSIHNRYFPYFEAGIGMADVTPSNANFTFKSPMAPFFKIGANYNFLYNSSEAYQLYAGLRYGFTPYRYSIDNVTVDNGYWDTSTSFSIPRRSATAGYAELLLGLNVKIVSGLSLGWAVGFHWILHESKSPYGKPMYIPGYGTRSSELTGNLMITYTLPLNKKRSAAVDIDDNDLSSTDSTE
ncbi:MAG: hypothetical protein K2K68_10255 [Duncaniella sp.]|nr:hypothetical protein [Duncaniella sp.]